VKVVEHALVGKILLASTAPDPLDRIEREDPLLQALCETLDGVELALEDGFEVGASSSLFAEDALSIRVIRQDGDGRTDDRAERERERDDARHTASWA
jgi:hypothetical protein